MKLKVNYSHLIQIILISVIIAFAYNYLSPNGIPFIREEIKIGEHSAVVDPNNPTDLDYSKIQVVKIDRAYELFNYGVKFIDSRDQWDFSDGHIKGAINFPEVEFETNHPALSKLSKDETLIIYCSSNECGLSTKIAVELLKLGYKDLYVFEEGWDIWVEHGYPTSVGEEQ